MYFQTINQCIIFYHKITGTMKNLKLLFAFVLPIFGLNSIAQNEKLSIGVKLLPGLSKATNQIENNFIFSLGWGGQFVEI